MNQIYIYLISGKSLNGKDSLYLQCKDKVGWEQTAFATKLKEVVADLYNFSDAQMYGPLKDVEDKRYPNMVDKKKIIDESKWSPEEVNLALDNGVSYESILIPNPDYKPFFTPRRILQLFGQQQRLLFPDIWASYVFNTTIPDLIKEGFNKFAITDVRFKNEIVVAEQLKPKGSKLIRIRVNRPGVFAKSNPNDISEVDLDGYSKWDYTIDNTGTLEDLRRKGLEIVEAVENKS